MSVINQDGCVDAIDLPTSILEFDNMSFKDDDGWLDTSILSDEQHEALRQYLFETYGVIDISYAMPFLILRCEGKPPPVESRPFTIAGAIAIWLDSEEEETFLPLFGENGDADMIDMDPAIASEMRPLTRPSDQAIDNLAFKVFPDCTAISVIYDTIVIEFAHTDDETYSMRLAELPYGIWKIPFRIAYSNGPMPRNEMRRRVIKPQPARLDSQVADETDYIKLDGHFYPGTLIRTIPYAQVDTDGNPTFSSSEVTAGVVVRKDDERRLACSYHNWEHLAKTNPDLLGKDTEKANEIFTVIQGYDETGKGGSHVGVVKERIGKTDVALVKLNKDDLFENRFMEIDVVPKRLLKAKECKILDKYLIDSFAVGKQMLLGMGWRYIKHIGKKGEFHIPNDKDFNPDQWPRKDNSYIALKQGIYQASEPMMKTTPQIRDRVCGSVLVRCLTIGEDKRTIDVTHEGGIAGIMHFADLQLVNALTAKSYLCYADSFQELIDEGWEIDTE